jgi:hypothetical protein
MPHVGQWEIGFAALSKFYAREGHCCPSRNHIEGNCNLGPWVSNQRYYKRGLSEDRKRRLDAMGFVWNWRDYLWEQGFTALLKFKQRERHCCVPALHCEGNLNLGYWVSTQRRKKNQMSAERRARLKRIAFVWNPETGGLSHRFNAPKSMQALVDDEPQPVCDHPDNSKAECSATDHHDRTQQAVPQRSRHRM